jgi:hypothetical protein
MWDGAPCSSVATDSPVAEESGSDRACVLEFLVLGWVHNVISFTVQKG